MKTHTIAQVIACLLSLCCLTGFTGCASMNAADQIQMLTAAGFRAKTPQTAQQKDVFAAAPSYKVHRATVDGRTFYAFKDERNGVAYVGGEAEYQRFQQLAVQKRIAQDNLMAAQMNRTMAMNWYGAWGYGGFPAGRPGAFWW